MKQYYSLISCLISLCISSTVFCQNELWYAIKLEQQKDEIRTYVDADTTKQYEALLNFINKPSASKVSTDSIKTLFYNFQNREQKAPPAGLGGFAERILGPEISESDLLTAIADVVIDHAKQELATAYFNRWAESIKEQNITLIIKGDTNTTSLHHLCPNTYLLVENSQANMNMQIGKTLLTAFKHDLIDLHTNIDKHLIPEAYKNENGYALYKYSYDLYNKLKDRKNITQALREVRPSIDSSSNKASHIINLITGISESMLDKNKDSWIDIKSEQIKDYSSMMDIYLNLLSKNKSLTLTFENLGIKDWSEKNKKYYYAFSSSFEYIQSTYTYISQAYQSNKPTNYSVGPTADHEPNQENKAPQTTIDGTEIISDFLSIAEIYISLEQNKQDLQQGINIAKELLAFYRATAKENYSEAVLAAMRCLDLFVDDSKLPKTLIQFLTIAADISQAENIEDAKNILNAAILPVGSYKIKRSVRFSSSINSYLGFNAGGEVLPSNKLDDKYQYYIGPFLPIGVDLSWSSGDKNNASDSRTLYFSVIDLGVLAGYRFSDSLSENVPQVKFEHIISPGVHFIYGFKNSPLSCGLGAQYTPQLREITQNGVIVDKALSLRFTAFVAVDIPLLSLGMKGKREE